MDLLLMDAHEWLNRDIKSDAGYIWKVLLGSIHSMYQNGWGTTMHQYCSVICFLHAAEEGRSCLWWSSVVALRRGAWHLIWLLTVPQAYCGFSEHPQRLMKGFPQSQKPRQRKSMPRSSCVLGEERKCREKWRHGNRNSKGEKEEKDSHHRAGWGRDTQWCPRLQP